MKQIRLTVVLLVFNLAAFLAHGIEVPYLTGRIVDNAQLLSQETVRLLGDSLQSHEMKTTNQVVVLTIPTLEGENIEDYAYRVFNDWGLGQKGKDNGILLIVASNDRSMRIEVGYGLEPVLTDLIAGRIIQNIMAPKFRNGDYDGGITEGAMAVIHTLENKQVFDPPAAGNESEDSGKYGLSGLEDPGLSIMERVLFGAFIFGIIGLFTFIGIFTPGFGWFLYFFLIPFWATFPIVVLGTKGAFILFIAYLILFPATKLFLKRTKWYKKAETDLRTKGKASIGGMVFSSGSSGRSGGSWSSGSSGFSGGGGSSGGGGASGGW